MRGKFKKDAKKGMESVYIKMEENTKVPGVRTIKLAQEK